MILEKDRLDANVWDGDKESSRGVNKDSHRAYFTPQCLYELVIECMEDVK